ncbi:MAG: autotransporter outer membrane beta-barrel domain-containing protein [Novosphingobium sp.]
MAICYFCNGTARCTGGQMRMPAPDARLRRLLALFAAGASLIGASGAALAQAAPPPLVVGSAGPVILQPNGQPYTQNIGNGNQSVRATVTSSERGLNIAFTNLLEVDPNFFLPSQVFGPNGPVTVGTVTARYGFETGSVGGQQPQQQPSVSEGFGESAAYRLFETANTVTVNVGGGITANVRAGGVQLASAIAPDAASAQDSALSQLGALNLPGRRLPAVVTSSGVTESTAETSVSAITARDTYVVTIVTFGPAPILIGKLGRCQEFLTGCQGGLTYPVGDDETNYNTFFLEDVYVTRTTTRTVTSSGTILVDIPFAAYGRVHAGVQTAGFDMADRFLARLRRAGAGEGGAELGRAGAAMFLEATGFDGDYGARGAIAGSHASFTGVRGGISFPVGAGLTLGLAAEGGNWRWRHDDAVLPESAKDKLWRIGGFLGWRKDAWRIELAAFAGRQSVRSTAGSTLGGGTSTASYDARVYGAGLSAGRGFELGGVTLTPSLALDWLGWHSPAFRETGGLAPLSVAAATRSQLRPSAGLALDYRGTGFTLGASARGFLVTGDRQGFVTASDVATPGGFGIAGAGAGKQGAELGVHGSVELTGGMELTLAYAARLTDEHTSHSGEAGIRLVF